MAEQKEIGLMLKYYVTTYDFDDEAHTQRCVDPVIDIDRRQVAKLMSTPGRTNPQRNACMSWFNVEKSEWTTFGQPGTDEILYLKLRPKFKCMRPDDARDATDRDCIRNMSRGECKCSVGRKLGAILWPELYAKNKQNTK